LPKDIKTNVVLEHKTKGFDKARQDNDRYSNTIKKMEDSLSQLKSEYKSTTAEVKNLTKELEKQAKLAAKSQRQTQGQGAFTQGLAQGGFAPGAFLQRGPGMGRQMAGMAVGRGLVGAKAGFGGSFTGVQGLQQFLGSIPMVGGFLSGQVGKLAGYSQQAIGYQKTKLGVSPYLSEFQDISRIQQARGRVGGIQEQIRETEAKVAQPSLRTPFLQKVQRDIDYTREQVLKAELSKAEKKGPTGLFEKAWDFVSGGHASRQVGAMREAHFKAEKKVLATKLKAVDTWETIEKTETSRKKIGEESLKRLKVQERAAQTRQKGLSLGNIAGEGVRLMGMNKEETMQFLGTIMQAGGGTALGTQAKGIRETAFGAKTMWGVQGQTSGAFLQAGRRGGLVGGMGQADPAFKDAINEGIALGLSGSEVNQWLQQIAQGINQFSQTGIEINVGSISKLATDIGTAGLSGTRAISMAQGISQYVQSIGGKGVSSGADIMMLRELGDYRGGGAAGYRKARSKLEEMKFQVQGKGVKGIAGSGVGGALSRYMESVGGDQSTKAEMLQRLLQKWGVRGSVKDFDWLAAKLTGAPMGEEQLLGAGRFAETQRRGQTELTAISKAGGITGAAARRVTEYAPRLKEQAIRQNKQIVLGEKFAKTLDILETNALKTSTAFHDLAGGEGKPLDMLTRGMTVLSEKTIEAANAFSELLVSGGASYIPW